MEMLPFENEPAVVYRIFVILGSLCFADQTATTTAKSMDLHTIVSDKVKQFSSQENVVACGKELASIFA